MTHLEDKSIPRLLSLEIKVTSLKLDFKMSSPLSHKLTETQPETDLHLVKEQQASETQNC